MPPFKVLHILRCIPRELNFKLLLSTSTHVWLSNLWIRFRNHEIDGYIFPGQVRDSGIFFYAADLRMSKRNWKRKTCEHYNCSALGLSVCRHKDFFRIGHLTFLLMFILSEFSK